MIIPILFQNSTPINANQDIDLLCGDNLKKITLQYIDANGNPAQNIGNNNKAVSKLMDCNGTDYWIVDLHPLELSKLQKSCCQPSGGDAQNYSIVSAYKCYTNGTTTIYTNGLYSLAANFDVKAVKLTVLESSDNSIAVGTIITSLTGWSETPCEC
jgi:hypothetical protein